MGPCSKWAFKDLGEGWQQPQGSAGLEKLA